MNTKERMETRLGLLYSDGSLTILGVNRDIDDARSDALFADENETDPAHFTRVVRVSLSVSEVIDTPKAKLAVSPSPAAPCPRCGHQHTAA